MKGICLFTIIRKSLFKNYVHTLCLPVRGSFIKLRESVYYRDNSKKNKVFFKPEVNKHLNYQNVGTIFSKIEVGHLLTNEGDKAQTEPSTFNSPHSIKRIEYEMASAKTNAPSFIGRSDSKEDNGKEDI